MRETRVQPKSPISQHSKLPKPTNYFRYALPSLISGLRLVILPFFAFSIFCGLSFVACCLFLLTICSDFLDGRIARRMGADSKFGAYFDVTVDFIFIFCIFWVFVTIGLYPFWLLPLILFVYVQFLVTSLFFVKIYDPIGKYYGSLLFGAIGLTLLFSGQIFYNFVSAGIVIVTALSLISRLVHFALQNKRVRLFHKL
jgi:phosphatidylglycerophosphate synthase